MACPTYKKMKSRGTSFYAFPSASIDQNLANSNNQYKLNFTKFALLNIPKQIVIPNDQTKGVLNFNKNDAGPYFFNFQPGGDSDMPTILSDQLVESLRNYVANYDTTLRESRINSNTDFYNINEMGTPTEMIFWKWCRKMNLIDLEPALHKIDWDKNSPDFDNINGSGYDYFQKYLWKERDVNYYNCSITETSVYGSNKPLITINQDSKFKAGDSILLSGITSSYLSANTAYIISVVEYDTSTTKLYLDEYFVGETLNCIVYLKYQRFVEYIGDIQATSTVQTSKRNITEITAHIPNQAGKTPTILFNIENNTNYYPGLEMPILPIEQQEEIVGAENTNSPIRLNPENYPGTHYAYFDTVDKTYKCDSGDKLRNKGEYYGINLTNNIGLDAENYFEKLTDFNSNNIDGLKIDTDRDHYLKMNLPGQSLRNFDEFNSTDFDGAPEDFEFNAILWYYELDDSSGKIVNNLFGIEFLNNPNDDADECDTTNQLITTYKKYVSNGTQDGVSYIFNLNVNTSIDNDVLPLSYDPTTTYNQFGFDLYQNILQSNAKLLDNFMAIVSGFTFINQELFDLRSLLYSQTDINTIKSQISNLNDLLELYSTYQFVDSDTTKIETNFNGAYPTLKVNTINTKYANIIDANISDITYYNNVQSGVSYSISIPLENQLLLNIYNNNNEFVNDATIVLNKDMSYKQSMDIYIKPNMSKLPQKLNINMLYNDGVNTQVETSLISGITLPIDLITYDTVNPTASTYTNSYYTNNNIYTYGQTIITAYTYMTINLTDDLFTVNDYVYIDNFYLQSGTTVTDFSGIYQVSAHTSGNSWGSESDITIALPSYNYTLRTKPKLSFYKGLHINILRTSPSTISSIADRYKITKTLL